MAYTIAIANQKGGVAKTTTALSLGACWAECGRRVLLVDADAQGNLTVGLNFEPAEIRLTLYDVLAEGCTVADVVLETGIENLTLLPASPDLAALQGHMLSTPQYEHTLRHTLTSCADAFDVIVIDCPPAVGYMTINALTAANLVLIPVQCEYYAAKGLTQILQIIDLVREYTNPELQRRIAITMVDKRTRAARIMLEELQRVFADEVCDQAIGIDAKLKLSQILGQPITRYARGTRATRQYRALADEVLDGSA